MQNSLRMHGTLMSQLRKWFPEERITQLRNLAWLTTGLFLARSVHLSQIARKLPLSGQRVALLPADCQPVVDQPLWPTVDLAG